MDIDPMVLAARLNALEDRVAALEQRSGKAGVIDFNVLDSARPRTSEMDAQRDLRSSEPSRPSAPNVASPSRPLLAPQLSSRRIETWSIESFVGARLYAALGAIVVVAGVGMFLKLAIDRGWFQLPPATRCLAGAGFGFMLLGAGELARRRINATASVGFSAAGIATVYASVLAGFGWYKILGSSSAFVLLAATSGLGIVVAMRANQVFLAALAMIAAYLAPLVMWKSDPSGVVIPGYLLAVLGFGMWLAGARSQPFALLRWLAGLGTVIVGSLWAGEAARDHTGTVLIFSILVWSAIHLELSLATRRWSAGTSEPGRVRGLIALSTCMTGWCVLIGLWATKWNRVSELVPPDWSVSALFMVMGAGLAVVHSSRLAAWRGGFNDRTDREILGLALAIQAACLMIVTVGMAVSGLGQAMTWIGLAVTMTLTAKVTRIGGFGVVAGVMLLVCTGRLLLIDAFVEQAGDLRLAGLQFTGWNVVTLLTAAAWAYGAVMLRRSATGQDWPRRELTIAGMAIALMLGCIGGCSMEARAEAMLIWSVVLSLGGWLISSSWRSSVLTGCTTVILAIGMLMAVAGTHLVPPRHAIIEMSGLLLTPWSVVMAAIAASWIVGARVLSRRTEGGRRGAALACVLSAVVALLMTPALLESTAASLSMWSAGVGMLCIVAHRLVRSWNLDDIGRGCLALAVGGWSLAYPASGWPPNDAPLLLHPGLWMAFLHTALIAATHIWLGRLTTAERENGRSELSTFGRAVSPATIGGLLFTSTSFEVARIARRMLPGDIASQDAAVSIWWGLFAVLLLAIGFAHRLAAARHTGLALLGVATAKAVLFDLRGMSPEWRVASFLGLGLLMLGVAVVYARITRRLAGRETIPVV